MKVLVCQLIYGNRPFNILVDNELKAGYNATYVNINTEGIANALNEGVEYMMTNNFDAIAFLANDIVEPQDWLAKKVFALQNYPSAGVVASSLDMVRDTIQNEMIISNWLISKETINKIGYFNEGMFPYGPIDLDYCQRCYAAGLNTYYVTDCLAYHIGSHATGNEYGWDKNELVAKYHTQHIQDVEGYRNGTKGFYISKNDNNGTT